MCGRVRAIGCLATLLLIAPAVLATPPGPASIRVPDWRVGDAWSVHVVTSSSFPWLDQQVTFTDEYVESANVEVGELLGPDASRHHVYWSNRSIQLPGYERPFLSHRANDLTTGASLLAPEFLSYRYGPATGDLLGLGVYRRDSTVNDTTDYESFQDEPELLLHDFIGGVDLAPGVRVERAFDFRPARDLVVESSFLGLAFETIDGRDILRGELTLHRTKEGVASVPLVERVWLADQTPLPVKLRIDAVAYPVEYHHAADLVAFAPGATPLPRGSCPLAHGGPLAPRVPVERAPYTADGPAAGDLALDLPLADAVALVRSPLSNPLGIPAGAVVVAGAYSTSAGAEGSVASWLIEFTHNDGTGSEYRVTRERKPLVPVPLDSVSQTSSIIGGWGLQPDGAEVLTLASLDALRGAFHEEDHVDAGLSFYAGPFEDDGGLAMIGTLERVKASAEGTPTNGRQTSAVVRDLVDGATGLSLARAWLDSDQTRQTRVLGQRYDGPPLL